MRPLALLGQKYVKMPRRFWCAGRNVLTFGAGTPVRAEFPHAPGPCHAMSSPLPGRTGPPRRPLPCSVSVRLLLKGSHQPPPPGWAQREPVQIWPVEILVDAPGGGPLAGWWKKFLDIPQNLPKNSKCNFWTKFRQKKHIETLISTLAQRWRNYFFKQWGIQANTCCWSRWPPPPVHPLQMSGGVGPAFHCRLSPVHQPGSARLFNGIDRWLQSRDTNFQEKVVKC